MDKETLNALWAKILNSTFVTQAAMLAHLDKKQDKLPVNETVHISATTDVEGVSTSGLMINVFYNDDTEPSKMVTTNSSGLATVAIPIGTSYRLAFPEIEGCANIPIVRRIAAMSERSVDVEYVKYAPETEGMQLTVFVGEAAATGISEKNDPVPDLNVTITIDGVSEVVPTDSKGKVGKVILYGKYVTVEIPDVEGKSILGAKTRTFMSSQAAKYVEFVYYTVTAGIFIITDDGQEYSREDFEAAVGTGSVAVSDAKLIKVITSELADNNGVFYVSIDTLATRSGIVSKTWSGSNVQFFDIPLNGNSATANYYYDGRTASGLIQDEGDRRNITTLAVDEALSKTFELGNGDTLYGFLGSVGQWAILWANRFLVDEIISTTRPDAPYNFSSYSTNKWTSTQCNAISAWYWATAASNVNKSYGYAVLPFFAY